MSGGESKPQTVTSVTNQAPWSGQSPFLSQGFGFASQLLGSGGLSPAAYTGNRVSPFSNASNAGLNMIQNRAQAGSPVNTSASGLATDTLQGDYLNGNPYLDKMYDRAAGSITRNFREATAPGIDSAAINAGRYGSNAWGNLRDSANEQLGNSLEGLATNLYGGNYDQERTRQMAALGLAPSIANQDYADATKLIGAGSVLEGKQDQYNAAAQDYYNEGQNKYYNDLQRFMGLIGGNYGQSGTSTNQQPMYGGSTMGNVASGAMLGGSVGGGWGALVGGGLGLLL